MWRFEAVLFLDKIVTTLKFLRDSTASLIIEVSGVFVVATLHHGPLRQIPDEST